MTFARLVLIGLLLFTGAPVGAEEEKTAAPLAIGEGRKVTIEYTLKLDDGTTDDTTAGDKPFVYQQGQGQILPALEEELVGLHVGEGKAVTLSPERGYGPRNEEAMRVVPLDKIPEESRQVGARLIAKSPAGPQVVSVKEIREKEIVLDMNHPLAGQNLHFTVKVLAIE